ncbi:MAG: glycoside hydrolase family 27 protein [Bifidobacteriaceae bacterium]|nr:glycoside hydrolase family 27 protein [Bifidobacteriaceae bacterium]
MPPRGWNSYNAFGGMHGLPADANPMLPGGVALEERLVVETADALVASGLRDAGYIYLNLDDRWQDPREPRGVDGRLRPDLRRFPSGMTWLSREIHNRGLKFGIYAIANEFACGGEEGNGPGGLPATGSLGREAIDARTFADWGVDFIKVDWCGVGHAGTHGKAARVFEAWNEAIAAAGRPMVLSASTWGEEFEESWAPRLTHMWRTTPDLHANWDSILANSHATTGGRWRRASVLGRGWNDPDALQVGHHDLTLNESWTHLVLWAMLGAPLLAGNDLRTMSDDIAAMLLDPDVIRIDEDRSAAATVSDCGDDLEVWDRELSDGQTARAVVNLSRTTREVPSDLLALGRRAGRESWWSGDRPDSIGGRSTVLALC